MLLRNSNFICLPETAYFVLHGLKNINIDVLYGHTGMEAVHHQSGCTAAVSFKNGFEVAAVQLLPAATAGR